MALPVIAMALVGQFVMAADYTLSATVPAPLPPDAPTITSPVSGSTTTAAGITITGGCPVVTPAVIIAIYEGASLLGSQPCATNGTFAVPITLTMGVHTFIATVKTITGDTGASSTPITVTRIEASPQPPGSNVIPRRNPPSAPSSPSTTIVRQSPLITLNPLIIINGQPVIIFTANQDPVWRGSFRGGKPPYSVKITWGDGTTSTHTVVGQDEQSYTHHYKKGGSYVIEIFVTDSDGNTAVFRSVAAAPLPKPIPITTDVSQRTDEGIVLSLARLPLIQIYIASLGALVFLWYLEHGRHKLRKVLSLKRRHAGRI